MESKRILITGGLGFVGHHLCEALLGKDPRCELTIVDNLSSTKIDYRSLAQRADVYIGDLRSYSSNGACFDEIYHLASPVGSLKILDNHGYIATDILELAQVASELAASSSAKLLYLSSSEVYGRDGQHDESADQIVPNRRGTRMEYALGKLTAEHTLLNLADSLSHSVRIIRPFNVIGKHQSEELGFVVPAFFNSAMSGSTLYVHGDGQQTRSFCAVEDLVAGLIAIQGQGKAGAVYNVGNPNNKTTILDLAKSIRSVCQSKSTIKLVNPTDRFGPHYLEAYNKMPSVKKAYVDVGWAPEKTLDAVLTHLHEYYKNNRVNQGATSALASGRSSRQTSECVS